MRKVLIRILYASVTFSIGVGIYIIFCSRLLPRPAVAEVSNPPSHEPPALSSTYDEWTSFEDLLTDDESLKYNGYLIERRYKSVKELTEGQGYVVLLKDRKVIRSFDGIAYHPVGNVAAFGLFSFLGTNGKQVAISQDVPRGGAQWIIDLSAQPKVIFDGDAWGIGREAADCEVKDLDGDGTFEISLPLTDFYSLMDKMSVGQCPLPMITLKYDRARKKFVPINHFQNQSETSGELDADKKSDEFYIRSTILDHMLELIYQGKRDQAWQYFNTTYNLSDKKEIERRVKKILSQQPVYKFIYKNRGTH